MNSFIFLLAGILYPTDCPPGFVSRYVKCGNAMQQQCVPGEYSTKKWVVSWPPCPGLSRFSGASEYVSSFDEGYRLGEATKRSTAHWVSGECRWYDNRTYKIYIEEDSYLCSPNNPDQLLLKKQITQVIVPFITRISSELLNFHSKIEYNRGLIGMVGEEYASVLELAQKNVDRLQSIVNQSAYFNFSQVDSIFNSLKGEIELQTNYLSEKLGSKTATNQVKKQSNSTTVTKRNNTTVNNSASLSSNHSMTPNNNSINRNLNNSEGLKNEYPKNCHLDVERAIKFNSEEKPETEAMLRTGIAGLESNLVVKEQGIVSYYKSFVSDWIKLIDLDGESKIDVYYRISGIKRRYVKNDSIVIGINTIEYRAENVPHEKNILLQVYESCSIPIEAKKSQKLVTGIDFVTLDGVNNHIYTHGQLYSLTEIGTALDDAFNGGRSFWGQPYSDLINNIFKIRQFSVFAAYITVYDP